MSTPATILVIDDQPASLMALTMPLREAGHTVIEAGTVEAALAAIATATPDVVVLDLALDRPSAALHQVLTARALPVLVVSGVERAALPAVAELNGWASLEKPVSPLALTSSVALLLPRVTRVPAAPPPAPQAPTEAAPTAAKAIVPAAPQVPAEAPGSTPPQAYTDPRVQIEDLRTRRTLRGLCALLTTGLTAYFESRGHTLPLPLVLCLTAMALGADAVAKAIRQRPGVTIGGAAALVGLAVVGGATGVREAEMLALLGAGAIPMVNELTGLAHAAARMRGFATLALAVAAGFIAQG